MTNTKRAPLRKAVIGFQNDRGAFFFAALFSGVINVLMLTGPLFMIQVYDRVLASKSIPTLVALSILTVVLYAFAGLLELVRTRIMVRVASLWDEELRLPIFRRVLGHAIRRTPGVGTMPLRDLDTVRQFVSSPAPFALFDMPWVPIYIGVNFLLHSWLGYLSAAGALILFLIAFLSELVARSGSSAGTEAQHRAHGMGEEAAQSAELLKAMGMENAYADRWSGEYKKFIQQHLITADRSSILGSIAKVVRLVLQSAALGLGAYLAVKGEISAGVIIAGSTIMSRALAPVDQAIGNWRSYLAYRKAQERLTRLLNSVDAEPTRMSLPRPKGDLTLEDVVILAPSSKSPLLTGINFSIGSGGGLAIIGPTGAGKSCLVRAIVGAWPIAKGAIRLDKASIDQWDPEQLGQHIGYVPQEVSLLTGTIEENIARFAAQPNSEEVVNAAKRANVHEMILRLPDGYNTLVGPTGIQLSGGQRQRIALARALYGSPALLVLDEPNSNLDNEGEAALLASIIDARRKGATIVLVAHRQSILRAFDHVLVVKEGRQVDFGPRDTVMQRLRERQSSPPLSLVKE